MVYRHTRSQPQLERIIWCIDLKSNISAHIERVRDPHDIHTVHLNLTAPLELQPLRCGPEGRVIYVTEHRIFVIDIGRIDSTFILIAVSPVPARE